MDQKNNYLINKVFTVPYIDKMIDKTNHDAFLKCVKRYTTKSDLTYGEAISEIYHYMDLSYRNEYYFKNTIFNQLLLQKHDLYNTAALSELPIAESKADFVMINGKGVVYEIKTDLDNFNRLDSQISDYYKAFRYVNVVVGYSQYKKALEILKDTKVGIYILYDSGKLICRKKALCRTDALQYETMFRMLRKPEFEAIILKHYKKLPEVNNFRYYRECLSWIEKINIKTFQNEMLQCLKQRTLVLVEDMLEKEIPYELRFYAYFTKQNKKKYDTINQFLGSKLEVQ